jgi:hypothetical protein
MKPDVAVDRDALYYPFIHITDVNWLKATLLCFPGVRRMVPQSYAPSDSDEIKQFCDVVGPRHAPLLTSVDLFSPEALAAEEALLAKLAQHDAEIRARFGQAETMKTHTQEQLCQLHDEKIVLHLYAYLTSGPEGQALAWRADPPANRPHRQFGQWLSLHPALGNAILSVKALAIANSLGLDIVTDSSQVHEVVAAESDADVFDALLSGRVSRPMPAADDVVDDLAEVVMTTAFDVRRLTAQQIADLLANGHDLRRFKNALVPFAATLPSITDPKERQVRLDAVANDVISEWNKYRKSLPKFALNALVDAVELKWPDIATAGLFVSPHTWPIGAGLGLAILMHKGAKVVRNFGDQTNGPYRYLSSVAKVADRRQSVLSIAPPP